MVTYFFKIKYVYCFKTVIPQFERTHWGNVGLTYALRIKDNGQKERSIRSAEVLCKECLSMRSSFVSSSR